MVILAKAYEAMNPKLRETLLNYIFTGGGDVVFVLACSSPPIRSALPELRASLFFRKNSTSDATACASGSAFLDRRSAMGSELRAIYFEGGHIYDLPPQVEVMANYANGKEACG